MRGLGTIFKRELRGYFQTPVAYVLIAVFLIAQGAFTFYFSNFYERGKADLEPMFTWQPWLYLFLLPAVTMRLWAEEKKSGTIELLITLPIPLFSLVVGKFLAAWTFAAIMLLFTLPMWLSVNYLGRPDNGVILASYIGSLLMAGGYLAIGAAISAMTRNQVIAFVVSVAACAAFTLAGFPVVIGFFQGLLPQSLVETIANFSMITHFETITQGVLEMHSLVFFASLILLWLFVNLIVLEARRR